MVDGDGSKEGEAGVGAGNIAVEGAKVDADAFSDPGYTESEGERTTGGSSGAATD